jgi:hypothetical protein
MRREVEQGVRSTLKNQLLEALLAANPVDLPASLIDAQVSDLQVDWGRRSGVYDVAKIPPREAFEQTARRRVTLGLLLGELVLEAKWRVQLPYQSGLQLGEGDPRGGDLQVFERCRHHHLGEMDGGVDEHVVHAPLGQPDVDERHAAVALGIQVDQQRGLAAERKGGREVDGRRRFTDATFLVGNRENHRAGACGFWAL